MNARRSVLLLALAIVVLPTLSHAQGKGGGRPRTTRKTPVTQPAAVPPAKVGDKGRGGVVVHVAEGGKHGLVAYPEDVPVMGGVMIFAAAQQACQDLTGGGFSDWYLPSSGELAEVWNQRTTVGGFSAQGHGLYWTSSRMVGQDHKVYWRRWSDGLGGWSDTYDNGPSRGLHNARCVRKF